MIHLISSLENEFFIFFLFLFVFIFLIEWGLIRHKPLINFMNFVVFFEKQIINIIVQVKQFVLIIKHDRV